MTLPAPRLDDRRFQELVDEAKRRVQRECPEWTDHNVSDPGVVLIELFADMTEQVVYRLNQVPDHLYRRFLSLLGVSPHPPVAARADVTFWLSAPQPAPVRVPTGTAVATKRSEDRPAVGFTVVEDLTITPCERSRVATAAAGADPADRTAEVDSGTAVAIFSEPPRAGDALLVDLSANVAGCAVRLDLDCDEASGEGVDPSRPPLRWEAWDGSDWRAADGVDDGTAALNRSGPVVVHVPRGGAPGEPTRLRCRVIDSDMPPYRESPKVAGLRAATVGGTARAVHGEATDDEPLGTSTGQPRQRFQVQQPPIVGPESIVVECRHGRETDDYVEVESFAESKPDSLHVTVERASGEIVFGPAIRDRSGPADTPGERPRQLGAIPPAGSRLVVRRYLTGGGEEGNVARGELQVLKTTIPFVARVENRLAATGGRAAETVEEACVRGPIELRTRERAVTAEDYEYFARRASGAVANARCVPPAEPGGPALLAVVPRLPRVAEAVIDPARLVTPASVKRAVRDELDRRRVLGARVEVRDAAYQGVRVDALVRVLPGSDAGTVAERATAALHRYFHPTRGGPDGDGWEFGRAAYSGMAYLVLQRVDGVEIVQELRLYPVDLATGAAGEATQRVELAPDAVVVSRDHRVAVVAEGTDE